MRFQCAEGVRCVGRNSLFQNDVGLYPQRAQLFHKPGVGNIPLAQRFRPHVAP